MRFEDLPPLPARTIEAIELFDPHYEDQPVRYARKRDANEREVITALREVGACVQQLDGSGVPDLLVLYLGVLHLLEVKDPQTVEGKGHRRSDGPMSELTPAQVRFWTAWGSPKPAVVHDPAEALRVIGAAP